MSETPPPPSWRDRLDLLSSPEPSMASRVAIGVAVAIVVGGVLWFALRQPSGPPPESSIPRAGHTATATTAPSQLVVDAAGAVQSPGVYHLPAGARVTDLIAAAGGATDDADVDRVNLAAPLTDGARIYVPRQGEAATGDGTGAETSGPLDLNTATIEQLDALPGIGPATAKAIVDERTKRGRFASVEDLLDVRGIGPAKLDAIRDLVTVS